MTKQNHILNKSISLAGRIVPALFALLFVSAGARADVLPVWWAPQVAAPGFVELEDKLYETFKTPMTLQAEPFDGSQAEQATDCPAAVDAFERGFYRSSDPALLILCRARVAAVRAREATSSTFRGTDGLPAALTANDLLTLPSLVGPYAGCAETLVSLRSDQSWWSLARHHHVYFGPEVEGNQDDGREADFIKPLSNSADSHAMQVAQSKTGGLQLVFGKRRGSIEPLVWGDFDGNGVEDMLVMASSQGAPPRLVAITRPKPGTIMTLLDPTFHYVRILDQCPTLALQQMAEGCIE